MSEKDRSSARKLSEEARKVLLEAKEVAKEKKKPYYIA